MHVGLCVLSLPSSLFMIVRIFVLNFVIIIITSEIWIFSSCLGWGHETVVCVVFLAMFLPSMCVYQPIGLKCVNRQTQCFSWDQFELPYKCWSCISAEHRFDILCLLWVAGYVKFCCNTSSFWYTTLCISLEYLLMDCNIFYFIFVFLTLSFFLSSWVRGSQPWPTHSRLPQGFRLVASGKLYFLTVTFESVVYHKLYKKCFITFGYSILDIYIPKLYFIPNLYQSSWLKDYQILVPINAFCH